MTITSLFITLTTFLILGVLTSIYCPSVHIYVKAHNKSVAWICKLYLSLWTPLSDLNYMYVYVYILIINKHVQDCTVCREIIILA